MCATARTHLLGEKRATAQPLLHGEKRATARPLLLQWSGMCEGAAVPAADGFGFSEFAKHFKLYRQLTELK